MSRHESPPDAQRQVIEGRAPVLEVNPGLAVKIVIDSNRRNASAVCRKTHCSRYRLDGVDGFRRRRAQQMLRELIADERAGTNPAIEISFTDQIFIAFSHRRARDAE